MRLVIRTLVVFVFLLLLAASVNPSTSQTVVASFSPMLDAPVLSRGAEDQWDSDVIRFPYVIEHEDQFHMFYEARAGMGVSVLAIGYAVSEDGIEWTKSELNPIFEGDGSGFDAQTVARPVVSVGDDGTWTMYYTGSNEEGGEAIGRAVAPSPTGPWERLSTPLLASGPVGAWDHELILADQIIRDASGYRMYYSGRGASGGSAMIGLATSSDGVSWEKFNDPANDPTSDLFAESDPVVRNGSGWDRRATWTPNVMVYNGSWIMIYNAFGNLGAAFSHDGIKWEKYQANPIVRDTSLYHPFLLQRNDGTIWLYYRNLDDDAIHLLVGTLEYE